MAAVVIGVDPHKLSAPVKRGPARQADRPGGRQRVPDVPVGAAGGRGSRRVQPWSAIERSAELLKLYEINRIARAVGVELADFVDSAP